MSRVGKKPISIPSSVQVSIEGSKIVFKGGKLTKELETYGRVGVSFKDGELTFSLNGENAQAKAYWGTYRALANNIVVGLTEGFTKQLEINGVGYKAAVKGKVLELALGHQGVGEVEPCEFILVGRIYAESLDKPVVERTVHVELEGTD